jgi:hypothetical protein
MHRIYKATTPFLYFKMPTFHNNHKEHHNTILIPSQNSRKTKTYAILSQQIDSQYRESIMDGKQITIPGKIASRNSWPMFSPFKTLNHGASTTNREKCNYG